LLNPHELAGSTISELTWMRAKQESSNPMTLGAYIRSTRKTKGLSLRELARRIKIAPTFLSDIERDRDNPSEKVLEKIAGALELDADYLKDLNPAIHFADLRDVLAYNRDLSIAFAKLIRGLKNGSISPEQLLAALQPNGVRAKR
jgi:transcriptional regulator with XRE-family HTH domain